MRLHALSSLLLVALLPLGALAKTTDRNAPMDIEADRTDAMLGDDSESVLTGSVKITQGSLEVNADRAVIHRKAGDISQVVLTGTPATLKPRQRFLPQTSDRSHLELGHASLLAKGLGLGTKVGKSVHAYIMRLKT